MDTNQNAPESMITLIHQQQDLADGSRDVQMFPNGTEELPLPMGLRRYENERGVFHYWPDRITAEQIEELSSCGKENVFLKLGPYSKADIAARLAKGEKLVFVTEYTPLGVEVRCAAGTDKTFVNQVAYFDATKMAGNIIIAGPPPERVRLAIRKAN